MPAKIKDALKWTQAMVCRECDISRVTFAKRAKIRDIAPQNGFWTTKQVFAIVLGDKESEKLRLVTEQADRIALENAQKRRELVPVDNVLLGGQRFVAAAKAKIMALEVSDERKDEILQEFANLATERVLDVPLT